MKRVTEGPECSKASQPGRGSRWQFAAFCVALIFVFPASASAAVFQADDKMINIEGTVDDDLYLATEALRLKGTVNGDVAAAGRRIDVPGTIAGAAVLAAQSISIDGTVERAARLAGRDIEIEGTVGRDSIAFAQSVTVGKAASVGRDLVVFGQSLRMEGKVGGTIRGAAATIMIDGEVLGNVDVDAEELELGPNAKITGDLTYGSDRRVSMADGAVVGGDVNQQPLGRQRRPGPAETVLGQIRSMIGPMVMGILLLWLLPPFVPAVASTIRSVTSGSLLAGLAAFVLVPLLAAILFFLFTVLGGGWSVPGMLLGAYGAALVLSRVLAGYALGRIVLERTKNSTEDPQFGQRLAALVLGIVILTILSSIPVVGVFAAFLPVVLTLGGLVVFVVRWRDGLKSDAGPLIPPSPPEAPAGSAV